MTQIQRTVREELYLPGGSSLEPLPQEASLITAFRVIELDLNPDNVKVHEVLLQQVLQNLEREHNNCVMMESLDINKEPEES
jgi:hypothetical protein